MHCWDRSVRYLTAASFDEAYFQTHLGLVTALLSHHKSHAESEQIRELISRVLNGLNECFISGFKLSTGLSMEILWKALRPLPIGNKLLLDNLHRMEQLASQFDSVKWQSTATVTDLAKIMDSFVKAYRLIRLNEPNVEDLLGALTAETSQLLSQLADDSTPNSPFMAAEFETMRQIVVLDCMSRQTELPHSSRDMILLSGIPLVTQMRVSSASDTSRLLLSMKTWPVEILSSNIGTRMYLQRSSRSLELPIQQALVRWLRSKQNCQS